MDQFSLPFYSRWTETFRLFRFDINHLITEKKNFSERLNKYKTNKLGLEYSIALVTTVINR